MKTNRIAKLTGLSLLAALFQPTALLAQKYATYDGSAQFTSSELYMMQDFDPAGCAKHKHFSAITNPAGVPALADACDTNKMCYEMCFPGCQYSLAKNFCMKCMCQPDHQRQFPLGAFVWHAFSIFVPGDFNHNPDWSVVYQFHDHPDNVGVCDTWQSPSFSVEMSKGQWRVAGRYNAEKCNHGTKSKTAFANTEPMVKGGWTHFVVHIKFDYRGAGRCEVWQKDAANPTPKKIADYSGPLGCNDDALPYDYVSFGYYYGNRNPGTDATLYFDRIIFGGAQETFQSMMYQGEQNRD